MATLAVRAQRRLDVPFRTPLVPAGVLTTAIALIAIVATDLGPGDVVRAAAVAAVPLALGGWLLALGGPAARGVGALLMALLGLPVSAGLAAELLTGGHLPLGIAGLAGLGAALILAVGGAVRLLTTVGWPGRLAVVAVSLAAIQFVVLPVVMATYGTHHRASQPVTLPPSDAKRIALEAPDGVRLVGWYTASRNGAAVVLLHGAGGSKTDTVGHARVLAAWGYGVLAMDARGSGESGGAGMLWGWHGEQDVSAAVTWLTTRPEVDATRIGAVGLSMGGEQAITAAVTDDRLGAVVAEGVSARVPADADAIRPEGIPGAIQSIYYAVMWGVADLLSASPPPIPLDDAVRSLGERRVLLISSHEPSDAAAASVLHRASMATVELWEPADTPHTGALATHPDAWIERVTGFLRRELGTR